MSGVVRSVGQLAVGAAAFALGGPLAFAGANLAFSLLFPPKSETTDQKPANLDLNISDPDGPIPCFWGTVGGVGGNYTSVAKDSNGKPAGVLTTKKTSSSGGKGGGGQKTVEYRYYLVAEMAIGYAGDDGPLFVDKLEMEDGDGNTVLFDRFAEDAEDRGITITKEYSAGGTLISETGQSKKGSVEFHLGTEEQQACSFLEEYWGVGNVCPLRGIAKIGFNRLQITSQPTFKITVRCETTGRREIIVKRLQDVGVPKSRMYIQQIRGEVLGASTNGIGPARTLCEQLASRVFCGFSFNNARLEDFSKENVKTFSIEDADLGAYEIEGDGGEIPDKRAFQMKGDDEFYSSVEATFSDADNLFVQNTGVATRHTSKNSNPYSVQIPEVARIADIVPWCAASLDEDNAADHTLKFSLLPGFCEITTGNVLPVPIERTDGSFENREYLITELNIQPSGLLQYTGSPYFGEVYDQPAYNTAGDDGDDATLPGVPIGFIGPAPALDKTQLEAPGVIVAATVDTGDWSDDGTVFDFQADGETLITLRQAATIGHITEDFALGDCYNYDSSRTLNITMYGDGVLQTADAAAVRAGANLLLFDTGRIISFTNATQTGDQAYQISGIKDGRFGSDAGLSSDTAVSGTKVLLLHNHEGNVEGSIQWKQTDFESYNRSSDSTFYPAGYENNAELAATVTRVYTAENVKPVAPVAVQLARGGDGSATLTGRLRTRIIDDSAWETSSPGTMTDDVRGVYKISIRWSNGTSIVRRNYTSTDVAFSITIGASSLTSMFGTLPATLSGDVFMTNSLVGDGRPRAFTEE